MKKITLFLLFSLYASINYAQTRYVTKTGAGTKDGSSWANASDNLQATIDALTTSGGGKVFVAKGTYTGTFILKESVKLYGGFAGTETSENDRTSMHQLNKTILSGDINGDDVVTGAGGSLSITNTADNLEHVIITTGTSNATILDGFTISGGVADHNHGTRKHGGGILIENNSSVKLNNLIVKHNFARNEGGGIYVLKSSPTITNCIFSRNRAGEQGGGGIAIVNYNTDPSINYTPMVINSTFYGRILDCQ